MESKKVSLISPVWNSKEYIKEFLDSIKRQTYRPLQFIFVNDGSSDGSEQVFFDEEEGLKGAGIETIYLSCPHLGQAAAMNAGLKVFDGEYLTWADSDDILDERNIEAKVNYLENHPEIAMVRNDARHLENGLLTEGIALKEDRITQKIFENLILCKTYVYAGCYMVKSEFFEKCYPKRCIPLSSEGQNLQMLLPISSRTECGFVNEVLMTYRIYEGSHSHTKRSMTDYLKRIDNFSKLLEELMPYCDCDEDDYRKKIEEYRNISRKLVFDSVIQRLRQ